MDSRDGKLNQIPNDKDSKRRHTTLRDNSKTMQSSSPRRSSNDSSILGKIKSRMGTTEEEDSSDGSKLSRLVPGRSRRKGRRPHHPDSAASNGPDGMRSAVSTSSLETMSRVDEVRKDDYLLRPDSASVDSLSNHLTGQPANPSPSHVTEEDIDLIPSSSDILKSSPTVPRDGTITSPNQSHGGFISEDTRSTSAISIGSSESLADRRYRRLSLASTSDEVLRPPEEMDVLESDDVLHHESLASKKRTGEALSTYPSLLPSKSLGSGQKLPTIRVHDHPEGIEPFTSSVANPATRDLSASDRSAKGDNESNNNDESKYEQLEFTTQQSEGPPVPHPPLASSNLYRPSQIEADSHVSSKLSRTTIPPPTSPTENLGDQLDPKKRTQGNALQSGFLSSVISVAQNAANTISNTLTNSPARPKSAGLQSSTDLASRDHEKAEGSSDNIRRSIDAGTFKSLAIETIGSGDLSLSHLGISETQPSRNTLKPIALLSKRDHSTSRIRSQTAIRNEEANVREENASAARAVSEAYSEASSDHPTSTPTVEDTSFGSLKSTPFDATRAGENATVVDLTNSGDQSFARSGSLQSKSEKPRRRHRNSSGTSAAPPASATYGNLLQAAQNTSLPKITGFAVASPKRNRDFHQLFRSVPEDDYLLEDYSCALQRDIILAGRIYISEGHVCFSSNILGWVTTLVISFDEVVSVEKENTAMVFPNAIAIQTLHARHTFRSLLSRDATYDLMIGIWKISHPGLQSSENGVRLVNGGTGTKTEKVDLGDSDDDSDESGLNEEVYDEDVEGEGVDSESDTEQTEANPEEDLNAGSQMRLADNGNDLREFAESSPKQPVGRKAPSLGMTMGQAAAVSPTLSDSKAAEKANAVLSSNPDFPGPSMHSPTECTDGATHFEKILKDESVNAPLGKVYSMVFGAASGGFMSRWLLDEVKVTDLQMSDDKKGLTEENKTRSFSYIKPLNSSIGPKSTKCIITEQLDALDLERAVSVTVTTQTPDVPSGNVFSVKTRYCLMWGAHNGTRIIMTCTIEWTGKSWIKGAIEKGANDGQTAYAADLLKALRAGVSSRPQPGSQGTKSKRARRRKAENGQLNSQKGNSLVTADRHQTAFSSILRTFSSITGILEPLHGWSSLIVASSIILVFYLVLNIMWWQRYNESNANGLVASPETLAVYEELWHQEDDALWQWLENRLRISTDSILLPKTERPVRGYVTFKGNKDRLQASQGLGQQTQSSRLISQERHHDRDLEWAINLIEAKLGHLKASIKHQRGDRTTEAISNKDEEQISTTT